jgi:hypothetical protein
VEKVVLPSTYPQDSTVHQKKEIKSQRVILDSVKDHLIHHLSKNKKTKGIFDALVGLFQSNNMNRKIILRNKLRFMQMSRYDIVTSYFMMITQVRDQVVAIVNKLDGLDLINVALNGFPKSWEPFVKGVCVQEKIL